MNTNDKDVDKQNLSQLMDGEWLDLSAAQCVANLCEDEQLRGKWMRYHMIRDVMKNEAVQAPTDLASRICAAIDNEPTYSNVTLLNSANSNATPGALDNQTTSLSSTSSAPSHEIPDANVDTNKPRSSWLNTGIAGFALAASVAVVTVVGVSLFQQQGALQSNATVASTANTTPTLAVADDASNPFAQQPDGTALPVVEFVANTGSYWVTPQSAQRVNNEERLNMMLSQHIENSPTSGREGLLPYSRLVGYDEGEPDI